MRCLIAVCELRKRAVFEQAMRVVGAGPVRKMTAKAELPVLRTLTEAFSDGLFRFSRKKSREHRRRG